MPDSNAKVLHYSRIDKLIKKYSYLETIIKEFVHKLEGKNFADDLICYLIEEFISKNPSCKDKILKAIDKLKEADRKDVVNAIKKTSRALFDNEINIFISYKLKDEDIATEVVESLRGISSKLKVTYAKDFEKGENYHKKIRRATRNSHWFILLLPDPADGWDWCLYESGLFRAKECIGDRLIVIHHEKNKIPDQICEFNAVIAEEQQLFIMLKQLICEPNPIPGMDAINPNCCFLHSIAKQIAKKVAPPTGLKIQYFPDFVELKIEDDNPLDTNDDMDKAKIIDGTKGRLSLFGKAEKPNTWGELICNVVTNENDDWRTDLRQAILSARNQNIPKESYATMPGAYGGSYRIILHGKRKDASGNIHSYLISFIPDICVVDRQNIPQGLSILAAAIKLAFRFRWEVLKNDNFYTPTMSEKDADLLRETIERISQEGMSTGLRDSELLKAQFNSDLEKDSIQSMYEQWNKMQNEEGNGTLDVALNNLDAKETEKILKAYLPMNKKFLKMASQRFADMCAKQDS